MNDAETAALLLGFARAESFTDRWEPAVRGLARAFDYFEKVGDVTSAVAAADCAIAPAAWRDTIPIVSHALQMVQPESHEAGRVLSRYAQMAAHVESDYQQAQGAYSRALTIARRERDGPLQMRILGGSAFAYLQALDM